MNTDHIPEKKRPVPEEYSGRSSKMLRKTVDQDDASLVPGDHPFNRYGYKYTLAEKYLDFPYSEFREKPQKPYMCLSLMDRNPLIQLSEDGLTASNDKGWCSIRTTHSVKVIMMGLIY
jgi:hypothetical protein